MKRKLGWLSVVFLAILFLVLLSISCGGGAETSKPTDTPTASGTPIGTPTASGTPHPIEGFEDCLKCHSSGEHAVPADHASYTNGTCANCHKPL